MEIIVVGGISPAEIEVTLMAHPTRRRLSWSAGPLVRRCGSVRIQCAVVEVEIVDARQPSRTGKAGILRYLRPGAATGYYEDPEPSVETVGPSSAAARPAARPRVKAVRRPLPER